MEVCLVLLHERRHDIGFPYGPKWLPSRSYTCVSWEDCRPMFESDPARPDPIVGPKAELRPCNLRKTGGRFDVLLMEVF